MSESINHDYLYSEILAWLASNPIKDELINAGKPAVAIATAKNERRENQDRAVYVNFRSKQPERCFSLLAVLDGMGGMVDGRKCAEIAISSIVTNLLRIPRSPNRLSIIEAINIANSDIARLYHGTGGTTFAGLFIETKRAYAINVGDSRIYKADQVKGLIQKSSDDRLGNHLAKMKGLEGISLNPDIADRLGQYVGMKNPIRTNVSILDYNNLTSPNSYFILTTDGAHEVGSKSIAESAEKNNTPYCVAQSIINSSVHGSSSDNATVLCVDASLLLNEELTPSNFDQLRVWSSHGVFNFVIIPPTKEKRDPDQLPQADDRTEREYKSDSKGTNLSKKLSVKVKQKKFPDLSQENHEEPASSGSPKNKLTIEQLTFEPLPEDDSPT